MTTPAKLPPGPSDDSKVELDGVDPMEKLVSEDDAIQSAKDAGMNLVDLSRVKHFRKIGQFLAKQGLVHVQRGKLLGRAESLEKARKKLECLLAKEYYDNTSEEPEPIAETTGKMMVAIAQTLGVIVKVENETAELDLKLEKIWRDDAPKVAPANRPLPPGASVHLTGTIDLKPPPSKTIEVQSSTD